MLGVVDDPSGGKRTELTTTTTISRAAFRVDIELGSMPVPVHVDAGQ